MQPFLSIITVCMNRRADIRLTCESIVNQSWNGFEWIVVDGASTDGTLDILGEYRDRMARLISERDDGIYDAMNKGILAAKGEYLLFMNGGDILASHDVLCSIFAERGVNDADILYGDILMGIPGRPLLRKTVNADVVDKRFFLGNWLWHQATFIKSALFRKYGLYDTRFRLVADHEKFIVFAENKCSFRRLPDVIAICDGDGVSNTKRDASEKELEEALARHFDAFDVEQSKQARAKKSKEYGMRENTYVTTRAFRFLGGRLSLFSVMDSPNGRKRKIQVLGVPVLKIRYFPAGGRKRYLFGFIPI